jgi:hypothetical protein
VLSDQRLSEPSISPDWFNLTQTGIRNGELLGLPYCFSSFLLFLLYMMTDTPTPYKATPEQWEHLENGALSGRPYNSARVVLELRDRIIHLEQQHETAKACILEIYERLDKLQHESNWARIVKLEEAQDAAAAAEPAPPAGALVDQIDTDLRKAFRKSVRSGVIDPLPEQRQNFLCLVLAIMQTESAEQAAYAAVSVIAQWLERHHTGRIANGSQFASLLREMLDREAGR